MYIQYKTEAKGIKKKEELQIPLNTGSINYVKLVFEETKGIYDNLFVTFYFSTTVNNLQDAETITKPLLDDIINLMVYKFNTTIKKPTIHSYEVEAAKLIATGSIKLQNLQQYELTETDHSWLCSEINSLALISKLKLNVHFLQYKSIMTVEDEISRFLLLYGLLYEIKGNQSSVDTYIKAKEPNVKMLQTTRSGQNYLETIYTWWRNQAQHMQSTTDIEKVTQQFINLVDSLQELVFEAIKNQISYHQTNPSA
ncbi:hypothetical protein [Priestia megaterium]|uniref:hypothetical protein n=1 Tax=Priestia megaterium TaxID=1404 RepID=UPI0031FBD1C6